MSGFGHGRLQKACQEHVSSAFVECLSVVSRSRIRILEHGVIPHAVIDDESSWLLREEIAALSAERREHLDLISPARYDHAVGPTDVGVRADERSLLVVEVDRRSLERNPTRISD